MRMHCATTLFVLGMLSLIQQAVVAQEHPILDQIRKDWQKRRQEIQSVRYKLSGQGIIPQATYNGDPSLPPNTQGDIPPQDYHFPAEMEMTLHFKNNWAKIDTKEETIFFGKTVQFTPTHHILFCDGEKLKRRSPRETNTGKGYVPSAQQPDLWEDVQRNSFFDGINFYPMIFLHGRPFPSGSDPLNLDQFAETPFRYVSQQMENGVLCHLISIRVHSKPLIEDLYWVDVGRASCILRWERSINNRLSFALRFQYSDKQDEWWPTSSNASWFLFGKLRRNYQLTVKEVEFNPTLERSDFQPERTPGFVVGNREGYFVVDKEGGLTPYSEANTTRKTNWVPIVLWTVFGITLILIVLAIVRIRKGHRLFGK